MTAAATDGNERATACMRLPFFCWVEASKAAACAPEVPRFDRGPQGSEQARSQAGNELVGNAVQQQHPARGQGTASGGNDCQAGLGEPV